MVEHYDPGGHRVQIRYWGNPNNEQFVVVCHHLNCGFRSPGGLSSKEAGDIQYRHWLTSGGTDGR